jgi:hypothetical protein
MIKNISWKNSNNSLLEVNNITGKSGNTKLKNTEKNSKNQSKNCWMKHTKEKCKKKKKDKDLKPKKLPNK